MKTENICAMSDSYKVNHFKMYPKGTEKVYSYFESRNGADISETVFFGLQYIIKQYLEGEVVTMEKIDRAEKLINAHLGPNSFNREGWEYIVEKYDGRLPVTIKAVAEGTPVPTNNVLMTVENNDPKCYWLTNYLETILTHVWYSSTVATLSREVKKLCTNYAETTCDNDDHIMFQLHDFGFRGVSSVQSAAIGGAGHLINFMGTDTIVAMELIMDYYNMDDIPAYSVPATEHSIMTSMGKEGEEQLIEQLLDEYPTGILSIVIDSYDYRNFIKLCGTKFKDRILERDGKVVFRPDSGDPMKVSFEVMRLLDQYFGTTTNSKGYKVLNPKVGMLWGDGIDFDGIAGIIIYLWQNKYSSSNIVFGMGGGLLQKVNRDTQRFAFKCSAQKRDGQWKDIWKDPIDKSKASKRGKLALIKNNKGKFATIKLEAMVEGERNYLETVFENGKLVKEYSFEEIRNNAKI
jgi:nicotinamide phosphoribosyltransferase